MLHFIIFGWPKKTKEFGPVAPSTCENCANYSLWHYVRARRWISLFFIPIFPISRADYLLICEICGATYEMDKETAKVAKRMTTEIVEFERGDLSEEQYLESMDELSAGLLGLESVDELEASLTDANLQEEAREPEVPRGFQ